MLKISNLKISNDLRSQLWQKATGTFGLKIAFTFLSFVTSIFLARFLGTTSYGIYTYTATWMFLLAMIGGLGFKTILVRELAVYESESEFDLLIGLLDWSNRLVVLVSLGLTLVSSAVVWFFVFPNDSTLAIAFWLTLAAVPFYALIGLRQGSMQGLNKQVMGQLPENFVQPILFVVLLAIGFFVFPDHFSLPTIIILKLISVIVAFIVGTIMVAKTVTRSRQQVTTPSYLPRQWSKSIFSFLLIGCAYMISSKTDILMLGLIRGQELVGIYTVASRGAEFIAFVLIAVNTSIAPIVARFYQEANRAKLQKLMTKSALITFGVSAVIGLLLISFGRWFLLIFGSGFTQGYYCLVILCLAQIFNSFVGSVGIFLDMTGHEKDSAMGIGISSISNIILNAILIPSQGLEGAAIATALSMVIWNVYLAVCIKQRLNLIPTPFGKIWSKK